MTYNLNSYEHDQYLIRVHMICMACLFHVKINKSNYSFVIFILCVAKQITSIPDFIFVVHSSYLGCQNYIQLPLPARNVVTQMMKAFAFANSVATIDKDLFRIVN